MPTSAAAAPASSGVEVHARPPSSAGTGCPPCRGPGTCGRGCSGLRRCMDDPLPGCSSRATKRASRLAIVPLVVRWPRDGRRSRTCRRAARPPRAPCRGGRAAVQGVVVGVDQHGGDVSDDCRGVRGLEHLARVVRVEEGVVVLHPALELLPRRGQPVGLGDARGVALVGAEAFLPRGDQGGGVHEATSSRPTARNRRPPRWEGHDFATKVPHAARGHRRHPRLLGRPVVRRRRRSRRRGPTSSRPSHRSPTRRFLCTGTLIAPTTVLTAGHCGR